MSLKKRPNTLLLNTTIKYNMNKRSESLFQKSTFSHPGSDKFFNFFITPPPPPPPPQNISIILRTLGDARKENSDFVSFVTILPIFAAKRPD